MDNDPNNQQQGQQYQPAQQQYPQPQQVQQQYPQQIQQPDPQGPKPLNIKLLAMIGGGFIVLVILIAVIGSAVGGETSTTVEGNQSLEISAYESLTTPFDISVPLGWTINESLDDNFSAIVAYPDSATATDNTFLSVSHDDSEVTPELFIIRTQNEIDALTTEEYQDYYNQDITELASENYGTETEPAFKLTYRQQSRDQDFSYGVQVYYIYQPDGSVVTARFKYTSAFADLDNTINAILNTFSVKPA